MKVFKFGGASVNSAQAVENMANIVRRHVGGEPLVVVVSAMGKTTNLLEKLVPLSAQPSASGEVAAMRRQLEEYHSGILQQLLPGDKETADSLHRLLEQLDGLLATLNPSPEQYNFNYDQVVSFGELLSTTIIAGYLNHHGTNTLWVDARTIIYTDSHYREGRIDWSATRDAIRAKVSESGKAEVLLTQGFIASHQASHTTTTLGREGSDYSASIIAHCLDAGSVTIWKDVPGFLNADPKFFQNTVRIEQIPYNEAIELAYYGASVIHPKTVKPIQNKRIPLYIKSFITPDYPGSTVGDYRTIVPETPLYIIKDNQILLSIQPRDYSFIAEDNLQTIFGLLNEIGIRVNMMQNSALSFSICMDNNTARVQLLTEKLKHMFHVRYNAGLQLITIRYYTQSIIDDIVAGRPILLEQRSRLTEQLIVPAATS